jgi:hypothetical protein
MLTGATCKELQNFAMPVLTIEISPGQRLYQSPYFQDPLPFYSSSSGAQLTVKRITYF